MAADESTQLRIDKLVASVSHVATLPAIARKIIPLVENTRSSARDLYELITHDPALVARILSIANSHFYGLPRSINSIHQAITFLGLYSVKNIALMASLPKPCRGNKIIANLCENDLWTHSVAVGIMSRLIVDRLDHTRKDEAFLTGLLHDIGLLVELQALPGPLGEIMEKAAEMRAGRYIQIEREILGGMDHEALGAALMSKWKFPRSFQHVTGYHHEPLKLAADRRGMTCVVHVADHICCARGLGYSLTCRSEELDVAVLRVLGLTREIVERWADDLLKALQEAQALLA